MANDLVVIPKAKREIAHAHAWYKGHDPKVAEDFLRRVEDCLVKIRTNPEAFRVILKGHRRTLVARFPYAIIYEYANETVVVYSVVHCSQDPSTWQARLP